MSARSARRTAAPMLWGSSAALAYVHVGYPLALELAARATRRTGRSEGGRSTPHSATVVICALDEAEVIGRKIAATLALDAGDCRMDVVVVTDGSTDGTDEIAAAFDDDRLTVLHRPERCGKSAAVNRGAGVARGEVLLFSDANNEWRPDAVVALLRAFEDPDVGGATGLKTVSGDPDAHTGSERWYWRYESWIRTRESDLGSCTGANGEILAIRRDLFRPIPEDCVVDDLHLALEVMRRGRRFVAVPDAVSVECASPTEADERERRARMAAGRTGLVLRRSTFEQLPLRVVWQLWSHKIGRLLVPAMLVVLLWSSLVLSVGRPASTRTVARWALGAQVAAYGAAVSAPWIGPRWPRSVRAASRAARYVLLGDLAVGAGVLRALRGRQSPMWTRVGRAPQAPDPLVDGNAHHRGG